ncbi:hypothetical protein OF83DRAFT_21806 [Amylostereum chailletii]|nr:hypothetical protein OF83DRAFT_21806 [Amylostereum chailletii]
MRCFMMLYTFSFLVAVLATPYGLCDVGTSNRRSAPLSLSIAPTLESDRVDTAEERAGEREEATHLQDDYFPCGF